MSGLNYKKLGSNLTTPLNATTPSKISGENPVGYLFISIYLSSLPVAHLCNTPRRRLLVTGDSARIQDKATENSVWFSYVLVI